MPSSLAISRVETLGSPSWLNSARAHSRIRSRVFIQSSYSGLRVRLRSAHVHVGAGRFLLWRIVLIAQGAECWALFTGALLHPFQPGRPPASVQIIGL